MWKRKRGNKLNAQKVVLNGITFDSKRESERYLFLKEMEQQGLISDLQTQVLYVLVPPTYIERLKEYKTKPPKILRVLDQKHRGVAYRADFVYVKNEVTIVEDVKSGREVRKDVYNIKKQLMWGLRGIDIHEVYEENLKTL